MLRKENLNEALADAVMDRPREFFIRTRWMGLIPRSKRFYLWSPTLGMSIMIERHLRSIGVDYTNLSLNPSMEALRLVRVKKREICNILSIMSFRTFRELTDSRRLKERARYFSKHLSEKNVAELIMFVLSEPGIEMYMKVSGLSEEQKEQSRIANYKSQHGHSKTFGGKTIYGLLIDAACKTYGWTKEYVVWGIDVISLRLMLSDSINSIYLTDEDLKNLHLPSNNVLDAGNPVNTAEILSMHWD